MSGTICICNRNRQNGKKKLKGETRKTVLSTFGNISAKNIFDAAKKGDVLAGELVDTLCKMLGKALANIAAILDPEVFVIGGGITKAGNILIGAIKKHYAARAFHSCAKTEIVPAVLGNDTGMYGCIPLLF